MKRLVVFLALALSFSQVWAVNNSTAWKTIPIDSRSSQVSGYLYLYGQDVNDFLGAEGSKVFVKWTFTVLATDLSDEITRRYSLPGNENYPGLKMFREVLEDSLSTVPGGAEVVRKMREVRNKLRAAWGGEPL